MSYDTIKTIITLFYMICSGFTGVMLIWWIALLVKKGSNKEKRKKIAIAVVISAIISGILMFSHLAIAVAQYS